LLNATTIDTIADAYHTAEQERRRIRPPSVQYEGFTIENAYTVQRRWVEIKVAEANVIKGHKIGLTPRAMQRQANITEPDTTVELFVFMQDRVRVVSTGMLSRRLGACGARKTRQIFHPGLFPPRAADG
jgi:2-keto-4-pentenoate hydratase